MQTSNATKNSRSNDPVWYLLAELSLKDFFSNHDQRDKPAAGSLFQILQELGISTECMENIARTLAGFAIEAFARGKQGRQEFPGRIRIFCQKKIIDDANSVKASRLYHTKQGKKHAQSFPDSGADMIGGWGYFMIDRGEDLPSSSSSIPHNYVDLYLYKEGE